LGNYKREKIHNIGPWEGTFSPFRIDINWSNENWQTFEHRFLNFIHLWLDHWTVDTVLPTVQK